MSKTLVLNESQLEQKLNRLAWQIFEQNYNEKEIIVAGIVSRGEKLSVKIADYLQKISSFDIRLVRVDIDKDAPYSKEIQVNISEKELRNKVVILVDDVLNSGKTLMYGAKYFLSVPLKRLSTVVLVDRNHNNYPIKADFVGISLSTTLKEHIAVELENEIGVYLS